MPRPHPPVRSDGAYITPDGHYRYFLRRQLADDPDAAALVFVMLNPSTADAAVDDPTIRRCRRFAVREGFGALEVVNLFAWRTPDPDELARVFDPVGRDNDRHILAAATRAGKVVAGWGAVAGFEAARAVHVAALLERHRVPVFCLGRTDKGWPRHPLFRRGDEPLIPWSFL